MTKKNLRPDMGTSLARERLEGRLVGGRFSDLANYTELFDRSKDAIFLVDVRNFEILEVNPAVKDLFDAGHPIIGSPFTAFFESECKTTLEEWLRHYEIRSGMPVPMETESSQGRVLEFTCAKVQLADYCEVFQIIARDVTEVRRRSTLLETQSLTDEMTGLSNFRSFTSRHLLEHARAQKKNQQYAILFFDVDHFKHFNDRNGHPAGDDALRSVAKVLRACTTRTEFVARYGGEEFVILCPNMDATSAFEFAETARKAIETENFPHGESQPLGRLTVSIGVALFDGNSTPTEILKQADASLYEAKKSGRNRVILFSTPTEVTKQSA